MTRTPRLLTACLASLALAAALVAQGRAQTAPAGDPITIKVGTLAPEGTPW
jgi:hypothetical protein